MSIFLTCLFFSLAGFAQKPRITWGGEFKLRKGSTDLEVIHADKSGVYLQEGHLALKSYFVIGATARASATLVKLDKNLNEVYRSHFNQDLKGKEFVQFFALQEKLLVFASEYIRSEKQMNIYGAEVNKNSGMLGGKWMQVAIFKKEERKDDINFKITYNADSTKMVIVSSIEGKEKNEYSIQEFDKTFKPTTEATTISNEFDPKTFQLEDVLYTIRKKIILVGRIYEYQEGKKKKEKFLDFANYNIRLYNEAGQQEKEINTDVNGKWLVNTKLVQEKDKDIVLAAFYSDKKKGKMIDGMLVQRIHPVTGEVISTSNKKISNALLSYDPDDSPNEEESKTERKERERLEKLKDEGEGFSKYMQFRNIFYTKNNELVILAEKYSSFIATSYDYSPSGPNGMPGRSTTTNYRVHDSGDILMCKIDAGGNIGWLQVFPKAQRERTYAISKTYLAGQYGVAGFFDVANTPYYSGFGAIQSNNSIQVFFNDNPKNAVVTQPGQKVKLTTRFDKSDCFILSVDEATGKATRKMFFGNGDEPTAMPRLGSVIDNSMYLVGKEDRLLGKTKIAVAKITINK